MCPFCKKELSENNTISIYALSGCECCGYEEKENSEVKCDNCKKTIYKKGN